MFLFFLSTASAILQSADLTPPFYPNAKNRVGFWNIYGAALVNEENIILAPPVQYKTGSAWSTLPLPYGDWAISFKISITEGNGGGGFVIPIIDQHAAQGNFYGIPSKFKGIALVGAVFANNNGKPELHYKLFQCNKTGETEFKVIDENDTCPAIVPLADDPFLVTLRIAGNRVSVTHSQCSNIEDKECNTKPQIEILDEELKADISHCWVGICAMSDDYTSRFDLFHAMFNTKQYNYNRMKQSREFQHMPSESNIKPDIIQKLRNPSFARMRKESQLLENSKDILHPPEADIGSFLKVMDEFAEVIDEVATYGQLNEFIGKTLVPYSEGWHRRTFKVMDTVAKTKKIMYDSFNETKALLTIFNETIETSLQKAQTKIGDIKTILVEESEIQLLDWILAKSENPLLSILKYISIGEVIAVFIFYLIQRHPKIKQKIYEY